MKNFLTAVAIMGAAFTAQAQDDSPVKYLNGFDKPLDAVSKKYIQYISATSHGASVRKSEKKRQDLLKQIDDSRAAIADMGYYKGDKSLQQSTIDYLKMVTNNLNESYDKMVNLEEIAEQSYDNMEAYLLLKQKVSERMEETSKTMSNSQKEFAKKYNINLIESESEEGKKIKDMNKVSDYYDDIYLIFFKCHAQEDDMMEAINKKNVAGAEQLKNAMVKYADEGLSRLDTMKAFGSDVSLREACRRSLQFYKKEADKMAVYTDFYMKETAFDQAKKTFENNPAAKKDKAEVEKYNKAVNEMNTASNNYNKANQDLNQQRTDMYNNWNQSVSQFFDKNMPYAG
jgi:hypothetical protein